MSEIRLETRTLGRHFGALVAVQEIDFKLAAGARHALIGPISCPERCRRRAAASS
jgi:ABC-type branched-subunit amino acid transport system ATPase component